MAFVVETGAGLTDSNAFLSVAEFVEYHTDRGNTLIDPATEAQYLDAQIQAALIKASDFIEAKFTFVGIRSNVNQAMEWPRVDAYYQDGRRALRVPVEVRECVAELAYRALLGADLAPDPAFDAGLRPITGLRQKVGAIEEETRYQDGGAWIDFKPYPFAERRMKELIREGQTLLRV